MPPIGSPMPDVKESSVSDTLIEEAVGRLDMTARLEGPNRLLFLDVTLPRGAEDIDGALLFLMRAAVELHAEIQGGEELSDIEETLEDALKASSIRSSVTADGSRRSGSMVMACSRALVAFAAGPSPTRCRNARRTIWCQAALRQAALC